MTLFLVTIKYIYLDLNEYFEKYKNYWAFNVYYIMNILLFIKKKLLLSKASF